MGLLCVPVGSTAPAVAMVAVTAESKVVVLESLAARPVRHSKAPVHVALLGACSRNIGLHADSVCYSVTQTHPHTHMHLMTQQ